jgi:hypothetical protein
VEEVFPDHVAETVESGGEYLPDLNLDTGRPDLEELGYGGLHRAIRYLQRHGGSCPTLSQTLAQGA